MHSSLADPCPNWDGQPGIRFTDADGTSEITFSKQGQWYRDGKLWKPGPDVMEAPLAYDPAHPDSLESALAKRLAASTASTQETWSKAQSEAQARFQVMVKELKPSAISRLGHWENLGWKVDENWEMLIPYLEPNGEPAIDDQGRPFVRRKVLRPGWKGPKYLSATGSGVRYYHSHLAMAELGSDAYQKLLANPNATLLIVEGEKKVEALWCHRAAIEETIGPFVPIGLSGVHCTKPGGNFTLPQVANLKRRRVVITFDSDAWFSTKTASRQDIQQATCKLALLLKQAKATVEVLILPRELDGRKNGVDDLIHRHGVRALTELLSEQGGDTCLSEKDLFQTRIPGRTKPLDGIHVTHPQAPQPACSTDSTDSTDSTHPTHPQPEIIMKTDSKGRLILTWKQKASLMAALLGLDWAWRPSLGQLYFWTGKHWKLERNHSGKESLKALAQRFATKQRWNALSIHEIQGIASYLANHLKVPDEYWEQQFLSFQNGVLDPATKQLRRHRREDYQMACLPFDWDPNAKCVKWEEFLNSATRGKEDHQKLLQATVRWLMQPFSKSSPAPLEKMVWLHGPAGGGKGTFLEAVRSALGDDCGVWELDTFRDRHGMTDLADRRYAIAFDLAGTLPAEKINKLISNEEVSVRAMYQKPTPMRLGLRMLAASNQMPTFSGGSTEGMMRRVVALPFPHPPKEADLGLKVALQKEAAGIWQWGMKMPFEQALAILKEPERYTPSVAAHMGEAKEESLCLAPFLRYEYPDGAPLPRSATEVLEKLSEWARRVGAKPPCDSTKAVGRHLAAVAKAFPDWVSSRRTSAGRFWTIRKPPGGDGHHPHNPQRPPETGLDGSLAVNLTDSLTVKTQSGTGLDGIDGSFSQPAHEDKKEEGNGVYRSSEKLPSNPSRPSHSKGSELDGSTVLTGSLPSSQADGSKPRRDRKPQHQQQQGSTPATHPEQQKTCWARADFTIKRIPERLVAWLNASEAYLPNPEWHVTVAPNKTQAMAYLANPPSDAVVPCTAVEATEAFKGLVYSDGRREWKVKTDGP